MRRSCGPELSRETGDLISQPFTPFDKDFKPLLPLS